MNARAGALSRLGRLKLEVAFLLVGGVPLLAARPAPLQDWPNHVARTHVLLGLLKGNPFWNQFYQFKAFLVPDAVMDLGLLGLGGIGVPPLWASACFLVATYAVFLTGFMMLARALGACARVKPVLAVMLFYNAALFWGLVSYVLAIALMMVLLSLWLSLHHYWSRMMVGAAGAAALIFVHAVAGVVLPMLMACYDLERFCRSKEKLSTRVCGSAAWLVSALTVVVILRCLPGSTGRNFEATYAGGSLAGMIVWKLKIFATCLLGGGLEQDSVTIVAIVACCVAVAQAGRPRLSAPSALATGGLFLLTLLAPQRLGTGSLLDLRLAMLPVVFACATVRLSPDIDAWSPPTERFAFMACALRCVLIAGAWYGAGRVFADFRKAAKGVPPGSLMMMAYGTKLETLSWQDIWSPPIMSLATGIVFQNVFYPALFANPSQQPMALRDDYRAIAQPWNLTSEVHLQATAKAIMPLCSGRFAGVFLTVLYPGHVTAWTSDAVLYSQRYFVLLDACRLGEAGARSGMAGSVESIR